MTRVTESFGAFCVLVCATVGATVGATGCSFHAEYHTGTGNAQPTQAPAPAEEASGGETPTGGRRHGVHVSVRPHGHHGGNSQHAAAPESAQPDATPPPAAAAPATHQGSSAAGSPIAGLPSQPAPATHQGSSAAGSPIAGLPSQPAPATHEGSSAAGSPIAGLPSQPAPAPAGSGRVDQGSAIAGGTAPNSRPDSQPSCRPFTLTARNGDVVRLRVVSVPESAEVHLDERVLRVASRSGQVWVVEIPADASTGTLSLVDGATSLRCGRLATSSK